MDKISLLLVPGKTAVDLQLLQIRCVVIQLAMNRSRRVSVALTLTAVLLMWRISVLERFFLFLKVFGWLRVICVLTKACSFASWKILT